MQIETFKRTNQVDNQKIVKNMQADSASRLEELSAKMTFINKQNENYIAENLALRQAQIEME